MDASKTPGQQYYRKTQNGFILETDHEQPLNDCAFDYYSRRIATCANDNVVKIYDITVNNKPVMIAQLNDHTSSVWRVSWSHPRYGSLLATCSYDKSVFIYKETSLYKYEIVYMNLEHKSSVNCIEWSPHEFGLHLACASSDGYVSVISYLPFKELTSEGYWHRSSFKTHLNGASCLCWEKSNNFTISSKSLNLNETSEVKNSLKLVTGGFDNQVIIWMFDNASKELHKIYQMNDKPHNAAIRDVAWKPSVNNANNVIASCSEDNTLILWIEDLSNNRWKNGQTIKFDCKVYKMHWSSNGSLFAVAGENDQVFLYKENAEGVWEEVCKLNEKDLKDEKYDEDLKILGNYACTPNTNTNTQQPNQMNSSVPRNSNSNMNYEQQQQNTTGMSQPPAQGMRTNQNNYQMNMNTEGGANMNKVSSPTQMNLSQTTTTMPTPTQTNAFTNNQNAPFESPTYGTNFNQDRNAGLVPSSINSYQPQTTTTRPPTANNLQPSVGYSQNNPMNTSMNTSTYQNTITNTTNTATTRTNMGGMSMPSQNLVDTKMNSTTNVNNNTSSYNNPNLSNNNYSSRIQMNPPIPNSASSVASSNMNNMNNAMNKQPSFTSYSNTNNTNVMPTTTTTLNPMTTTNNSVRSFQANPPPGVGSTTNVNRVNPIPPPPPPPPPVNAPASTYTNNQMGQQMSNGMQMNTNQQTAYGNLPRSPIPPPSQK